MQRTTDFHYEFEGVYKQPDRRGVDTDALGMRVLDLSGVDRYGNDDPRVWAAAQA
jgi:hypothetical protein